MQAVILAGGFGSRLSEETHLKPKPLVDIGGMPILWHIMKIYSSHGINDFVICLGYKGYLIKEYFQNYFLHASDVEIDIANNSIKYLRKDAESWNIKLIDTGANSMTGGRLKRVQNYIDGDNFCFTYGDGVADIDITELINFHLAHKKIATVTVATPPGRFGAVNIQNNRVLSFEEKPEGDQGLINAGFFVLSKDVFRYLEDDSTIFEQSPLKNLSKEGHLFAYHHKGFWQCMDTVRDKNHLEELIENSTAPWITWN